MNINSDAYERIEAYLSGQLSSDDQILFEEQMIKDENFANEVDLHRALQRALEDKEVLELENLLLDIQARRKKASGKRLPLISRRKWLAAAAVAIILTILGYFILPNFMPPSYEKYFEHYPSSIASRSLDKEAKKEILNKATTYYGQKKYDKSLPFFKRLAEEMPEDKAFTFYASFCSMKTDRLESAMEGFNAIIKSEDSGFVEPAEWYKVKILLVQGEKEAALELLQHILDSGGDFSSEAQKLIKDLN